MTPIWIELIKAAVDLARVAAWPSAVVFLALKFKPELLSAVPSLFRRKVEVEALGVRASIDAAVAEQQQAVAENPAEEKLSQTSSLDPSPRPAVTRIENEMRNELQAIDPGKKEAVLLRYLAQARLDRGHEYNYNRIFGSQIGFLKRLNEVPRITVDQARDFFKHYADQFPQVYSNYSFDAWLNFMTVNALAVRNGNDLEISEIGRDFLIYIINQRLLENKPW
jgi:hypothetical protein